MSKDFFKKHYALIRLFEITLDLFFLLFSFLLVVQVKAYFETGDFVQSFINIFSNFLGAKLEVLRTQILYIVVAIVLFMVYQVSVTKKRYSQAMAGTILALVMTNVFVFFLSAMMKRVLVDSMTIGFTLVSQLVLFAIYKYVFYRIILKIDKRCVLIIGPESEAKLIATKFLMDKEEHRHLKYVLFESLIKDSNDLIKYIDIADDIILLEGLSERYKNNIMTYCLSKMHKRVYLIPKLYEINIVNSKIDQIRDTPVFVSQSLHLSLTQRFIKRATDIIIAIIGLIISAPILAVVALLIKFSDKGPVFYKQERVTRNNRYFTLIKFRTMIVDAEKHTGAVWQLENDPRVTKIGKLLRATRIDELPQLINVLKGEMSLIGPRPEREIFIQQFVQSIPDFKFRVNVKPGITGLAQVLGKYNSEPVDKLRFDLLYIRNYSFLLDIKILFLTVKAVLDRDASATLGIPSFESILEKENLVATPFILGVEIKKGL
ncbi:Exopolysaccharide biosynthesis polyprenyl glycosylphosphotransferase [Paracholeplasma brassicae]|uniref:Exopolysaccharide biosynthesis polyprenyl glycosylphosphotransferase n=1 Tax=Acholeplasma brassicae TaxID=61635 RepID=U4KM73_9MOLU|nr:sugar transferase [Paracholeplasma brassicae]CCV65135.1 Exopolysaccharide biosynthesis polyprenyl glycosylphosphotransferase [Paracholeplasma brassicae]